MCHNVVYRFNQEKHSIMKLIKAFAATLAASLILVVAFILGANQYRINGWPFNRSYFTGVFGQQEFRGTSRAGEKSSDDNHKKQIPMWVDKLRKGGYILYFRHANREKWEEVSAFDAYELMTGIQDSTQATIKRAVCLSEQGVEEAKIIGKIFKLLNITTGTIVSSPSCRAKQTATYAFDKIDIVDNSLIGHGMLSAKVFPDYVSRLKRLLLNVEIRPGTNTVFVGHAATLEQNKGLALEGRIPPLDETGFYIIKRKGNDTLTVVYSVRSIAQLAANAVDLPLQ